MTNTEKRQIQWNWQW